MHYLCLVVGEDVDTQLSPFAEYAETEPSRVFMEDDELNEMAAHYGVEATDLEALAARVPDWHKAEGGIEDSRLFYWSTANPHARFDWYQIGGRFDGYLRLRDPAAPSWWGRLLGKRPVDRVNRARKRDVSSESVLNDPPAALLMNGHWYESAITSDQAQLAAWRQQFGSLFRSIHDDALLTAVDMHS